MKPILSQHSFPGHDKRQKGVALVIVLAVLVLVTALVVGFLVRTGSERAAAASYRATARTRQLADVVVNLVQAQINQATSPASLGSPGNMSAWASQPGAVRVFDNSGNQTIYRLYSANTLTTLKSGTAYQSLANDLPSSTNWPNWLTSPSEWVDLNAPAPFTIAGQTAAEVAFPILDPRDSNSPGNAFAATSGTQIGFQVNPSVIGITTNTGPIAPMPVQWLYVLQDGTIVPPNLADPGTTGTTVVLTPGTTVSGSNPIVGRIAFWTDDDTCRVNINTAGDGTFWDTPHFEAPDDWLMAYYSPASYEYQRYPGHPATTSLLPVLSAVNPTAFPQNTQPAPTSLTLTTSSVTYTPYQTIAYWNLFGTNPSGVASGFTPGLLPRYAYGGSQEGTFYTQQGVSAYGAATGSSIYSAPFNSQRLFPSVGEMLFEPNTSGALSTRTPNGGAASQLLTPAQLETAKFFLTAHSRAPELNLFGTPRVSIWPFTIGTGPIGPSSVTLTPTYMVPSSIRNTPTDQLLAFASTINGSAIDPFYFMRASNSNPNTDIGITRTVNGIGAAQNQQVLNYLDNLMYLPVPGFGTASFEDGSKYTQTAARQILTEIFDYIRTTDTEDGDVIASTGNKFEYNYGQAWGNGEGVQGHVVPTLTGTMWASTSGTLEGFGTFPRPNCITLHFVTLGSGTLTSPAATYAPIPIPPIQFNYANYAHVPAITGTAGIPQNALAIQAFIYVQFVIPASARLNSDCPSFGVQFKGLQDLALTAGGSTVPLGFPATTGTAIYNSGVNFSGGWKGFGNDQFTGPIPITSMIGWRTSATNAGINGVQFPFYSQIISLPYAYSSGNNTMTLTGGSGATMILTDAYGDAIQTVALDFNAAAKQRPPLFIPVNPNGTPGTPIAAAANANTPYTTSSSSFLSPMRTIGTGDGSDRWQQSVNTVPGVGFYIDPYHDVTASLVLNSPWDDPRMLAMANVPKTAFTAHKLWGSQMMAQDLTYSMYFYSLIGGSATGTLVLGANYTSNFNYPTPVYPCVGYSASTGVVFTSTNSISGYSFGDWDNGVSIMGDGPWINRADEGGASNGVGSAQGVYLPYFTGGNSSTSMGPGIFSPNREIPSPVTFCSLPTGVPAGLSAPTPKPWQTLLFRPGQAIYHPGRGQPTEGHPPYTVLPDHLLLDLFWMPVAEPYAISEPFSTAGKVNLNYQILPFGYVSASTGTTPYIKRDTGIRSALTSLQIASVPLTAGTNYKSNTGGGNWWGQFVPWRNLVRSGATSGNLARIPIDLTQTLQQFDNTFNSGGIFQSASEICDLYLVPQGYNLAAFSGAPGPYSWYGPDFGLVGNNVRDRPYADIYSRITTKSNTFTVYFTVQELKNSPTAPAGQWNEATGTVVGEYRGSVDLERYLQQNANLPDFLANPTSSGTMSLESSYRWRVLENNQFAP